MKHSVRRKVAGGWAAFAFERSAQSVWAFQAARLNFRQTGKTFQDDRGDESDADADGRHDADDYEGGEGAVVRSKYPFTNLFPIIINDHRLNFACYSSARQGCPVWNGTCEWYAYNAYWGITKEEE